jgi:membrane fusion protein (multidrug efflux system)
VPAVLALATSVFGLALACERVQAPSHPPDTRSLAEPVLEVTTARVRPGSILQRIIAPGSLMALRESRIGPEVSGRIEEIFVSEGDRPAAGDPLFQIERKPYELALAQAEARLARARAERRKLEADLGRGRALRERDILAQQQVEELETNLAVASAAQREAEELVSVAKRDLETTLVRAPYTASVAARLEDEGTTALVRPQTIVLVLQETSELEAQATIPEVHFAAIEPGDAALLHVEGLSLPIATEVSAVSDVIDPATRTYLVKMRVPNEDRGLKAGTFARVEILPRAKSDVVLVPREAVRREDGRTQVLLVREGRVVAQPVQLGIVSEDAVEVLRGVRVDDEIVVGESVQRVASGMRVRTVPLHRAGATSAEDAVDPDPGS